ncbi:TrbI/VirB10 family protein [Pantoea agglomerans]|uniref:TrbI/VirB10 family protein n=1 Tax=Enterobacter agglomerans TaxID=549 RepID=UPI003208B07E
MADQDKMSPDSSPASASKSGVRRINKRPLYIGLGVALLFCLVVAYVANKRSQQNNEANAAVAEHHGSNRSSSTMADEVLGSGASGVISAPKATPPELPVADNKPTTAIPVAPVANPDQPPVPERTASNNAAPQNDPALEQIRQNKQREFEEAVKSKTAINLSQLQNSNGGQMAAAGSGTPKTREEMLQEIANVRRQIDMQNSGDPTANYEAQVQRTRAAISGSDGADGMDGGSGGGMQLASSSGGSRNDISQYGKKGQGDRWLLDEQTTAPHSPYELRAGWVIPGVMISGINSDLPGQIVGQVSQDVYDTATGKYLLIPHGTRLVGTYSSDVAYGQEGVMIAWQRLVFPDGKSLDLSSMPGADMAGYSGFRDQTNNHYLRIFGNAFLLSGITAAVGYSQSRDQNSNSTNQAPNMNSELSSSLGQVFGQVIAQVVQKNLNIAPTLEIRPGYRFNVTVTKDLVFKKPYQSFDY